MRLPLYIICLGLLLGVCASAHGQVRSGRKAPPPKRTALFVGAEAGYLPRGLKLLPTASALEAQASKLSARVRNMDPFGLATFPREDADPLFDDESLRPTPRITLNQALQTLKVNGVNLQTKEFLIGGRNAQEGDVIELTFKEELFQAQVLEITASEILFRDLKRDESGVLPHKIEPQIPAEPIRT